MYAFFPSFFCTKERMIILYHNANKASSIQLFKISTYDTMNQLVVNCKEINVPVCRMSDSKFMTTYTVHNNSNY